VFGGKSLPVTLYWVWFVANVA